MAEFDVTAVEHRLEVQRTARIYSLGALRAPDVWIVLHGYGQLAGRFIRQFEPIAGPHRAVVAPEALNRFYLDPPMAGGPAAADRRVGTTWMTREDRDAEIADYVAYLDRMASRLVPQAKRLTVLGFSQGVATAGRWVALGSTSVQRLIVWAGLLPPDLDYARLAQRTASTPIDIVVGDRDKFTLAEDALERQLALLREAQVQYRLVRFEGGHIIDAAVLARLAATA